MKYNNLIFLFLFLLSIGCRNQQKELIHQSKLTLISHNSPNIQYMGRVGQNPDSTATEIYWSASSVKINFEGRGIKVVLKDENYQNYFNVIIDGKVKTILRPDTLKATYTLAKNLPKGKHTVELFKRTEWTNGKTWVYGFLVGEGTIILKPSPKNKRMIEFYGNSILCGYAVEDYSGNDNPDSIFTNSYLAYGAITGRHFKADYALIARSGIGLTISWYDQLMQDIYNRLDPADSSSIWDFFLKTPDIIVVNLFQNDSWLTNRPEFVEFKRRFGETKPSSEFIIASYADFIAKLRGHYPQAVIICMLGNMDATQADSVWPGYIEAAVERLGDEKIYSFFVAYKGTGGHPTVAEQQGLADELIGFMEENVDSLH